jgi:hypothetical protein
LILVILGRVGSSEEEVGQVGYLGVYLRLRHLAWRFDWGWLAVSLIHVHLCIYSELPR